MSDLDLIREMNRVKVMFQARTLAAVLDIPFEEPARHVDGQASAGREENNQHGDAI